MDCEFYFVHLGRMQVQDQDVHLVDSGEGLFTRGLLLLPSRGRKMVGMKALWSPFYKSTNLFHGGAILWPNYFPKALPSNTITLDVEISAYEFWGGHKQSMKGGSAEAVGPQRLLAGAPKGRGHASPLPSFTLSKSWWHLKHVLEWSDNLHLALE